MSNQMRIEKREKSLAELVMVIILMALLIGSFISYFMKNKDQITRTGFDSLANSFITQVNVVHSQWFMDKQPATVVISSRLLNTSGENESEKVPVNAKGWIDVGLPELACQKIWQHTLNAPMEFVKSPVSSVEVKNSTQKGRICRYSINSGAFFEYHTFSGKVIIRANS